METARIKSQVDKTISTVINTRAVKGEDMLSIRFIQTLELSSKTLPNISPLPLLGQNRTYNFSSSTTLETGTPSNLVCPAVDKKRLPP